VYGRIAQTDVSRKINGSHIKRHSLESVSRCELLEDFLSFPKTSTENRGSRFLIIDGKTSIWRSVSPCNVDNKEG
jgi:hypothetical protein